MASKRKSKASRNTTIITRSQTLKLSETIANNDELLIQILMKLPLKSLMKFTSVSKHWLSLISGPDFSRRRNPSFLSVSGLFLRSLVPKRYSYDFVDLNQSPNSSKASIPALAFVDHPNGIKIVHSCNGLLLCSTNQTRELNQYYVYNPTAKKYTVLPPLPRRSGLAFGMSLAFDPLRSRRYKVLCLVPLNGLSQIVIYSSETRNWRLSGAPFLVNEYLTIHCGVFWNGAHHWADWRRCICFNVDEERVSFVPFPASSEDWPHYPMMRYLGESRGHLHLILFNQDNNLQFNVFELEMDYSGWFLKFRVDCSQFFTAFPEIIPLNNPREVRFHVVHIDRGDGDGDDDESYAVVRIPGKVIRYNFKSTVFHKLCDEAAGVYFEKIINPEKFDHQYIESLAPV